MNMQQLKVLAKEKIGKVCRVCPVCNGLGCRGEVPGLGGIGTGTAFYNSYLALQDIKLNMRTTHHVTEPDTSCTILGTKLSLPVIGAPIAGVAFNLDGFLSEAEYAKTIIEGCKAAGSIGMTGDGRDRTFYTSGLEAIQQAGCGIPTAKPRPNQELIALAKQAEQAGAKAIAIDIDAAALINMTVSGQPVSGKTLEDLRELKANINLPIIIKGILTPECALQCVEAGVDAIVVSNHGGRVLDYAVGTAAALPAIKQAVGDRLTILVDGAVRSGTDVLKMLALGADAVLVGRPLSFGACGGVEGVEFMLNKFRDELIAAMIMTGCQDIKSIDGKVIYK